MRALLFSAVLIVAFFAPTLSTAATPALASTFTAQDGKHVFETLVSNAQIRAAADRVAPFQLRIALQDGGNFDYRYESGAVSNASGGSPDFTLTTTRDIALSVINAEDGFHVLACALNENAATLSASNPVYGASLNAAKSRIVSGANRCHISDGREIGFKGLSGTIVDGTPQGLPRYLARMGFNSSADFLAFNTWGAPTAWLPAATVHLCQTNSIFAISPCDEPGFSSPSNDVMRCDSAIQSAYPPTIARGWDQGKVAADRVSSAAEHAACNFLSGGVS